MQWTGHFVLAIVTAVIPKKLKGPKMIQTYRKKSKTSLIDIGVIDIGIDKERLFIVGVTFVLIGLCAHGR